MNYSKLLKENGKTYLFAEGLYNEKAAQTARLQAAYADARQSLDEAKCPTEAEWLKAITEQGADGLKRVLRNSVYEQIKRLSVPVYMAQTYRDAAHDYFGPEIWNKADAIRETIRRESDGLPLETGDISVTDAGVVVDADAIMARVRVACLLEVTPELMADAQKVLDLAEAVRGLELAGLNALELVHKFVNNGDTPAPISLFTDICTRRHLPGQISQTIQMPLATFASMYQPKQ